MDGDQYIELDPKCVQNEIKQTLVPIGLWEDLVPHSLGFTVQTKCASGRPILAVSVTVTPFNSVLVCVQENDFGEALQGTQIYFSKSLPTGFWCLQLLRGWRMLITTSQSGPSGSLLLVGVGGVAIFGWEICADNWDLGRFTATCKYRSVFLLYSLECEKFSTRSAC